MLADLGLLSPEDSVLRPIGKAEAIGDFGDVPARLLKQDFGLGGVFAGVSILMAFAGLIALLAYRLRKAKMFEPESIPVAS